MIAKQLEALGIVNNQKIQSRFEEQYKTIWAMNGDHVSRIYAGTGALEGRTTVSKHCLLQGFSTRQYGP